MAFVFESSTELGDPLPPISTSPLEDGVFEGSDSGRLGSYSEFNQESADNAAVFNSHRRSASFLPEDDIFAAPDGVFHPDTNGESVDGAFVYSDGPILPPPSEMREECFALVEWRRENAARLEEKEKMEKEAVKQIIQEASEYKVAFYEKRKVICENNKTTNREKEKVLVANLEKFHKEADQDYWKAIAELIPNEVPALEKKRKGKKDQEKKPSVTVFQGPKPGKPTDLSRMRRLLVKLKHSAPPHLKLSSPAEEEEKADNPPQATAPEAIAAA